ncbi:MAG: hypothetical protein J5845_01230 [Lachnospiraceae bacterium]|nr:hypothetical protein [Lachnospiraceae bacterium]
MKKKATIIFAAIMAAVLLTACGTKEIRPAGRRDFTGIAAVTPTPGPLITPTGEPVQMPTPTPTSTPTPTPTPTPTVEPTPDPLLFRDIADIYPEEYKENLYRIRQVALGPEYAIRYSDYRDEYVLLVYMTVDNSGFGSNETGEYCVFPLRAPEHRVYGATSSGDPRYELGPDGYLFEISDTEIVRKNPFDRTEETWRIHESDVYLGSTDDGKAWIHTADGYVIGYAFGTDRTRDERFLAGTSAEVSDRLLGEENFTLYLRLGYRCGEQALYAINRANGRVTVDTGITLGGELYDWVVDYETDSEFRYSKLSETDRVCSFKKEKKEEFLSLCAGNRILSRYYEERSNGTYEEHFRVLSALNGGEAGRLDTSIFRSDYQMFDTIGFDRDGRLLIAAYREDFSTEIFLLDTADETPKAAASYQEIVLGEKYPLAEEIAKRVEETYPGVHVYYEQAELDTCRMNSYTMRETGDEAALCEFMELLEEYMAKYPEGFFTELCGEKKIGLNIYLCGSFKAVLSTAVALPAGVTNTSDVMLEIAFDIDYPSVLEQNFAHELMHTMESRIGEYEEKNGVDFRRYWLEELNTPEYPIVDSYFDKNGKMLSDYSGTALYDSEDAWFIDAYAKSTALEDRARTFEYMYLQSEYHFKGEHLRNKAEFLCAVIREVFPSVAACENPLPWEYLFGIISAEEYLTACKADR